MYAKYERRVYRGGALVWAGQYRNLKNLPHWHKECEVITCQSGSAIINMGRDTYTLNAGFCIFIPSEMVHCVTADEDTVVLVAIVDTSLTSGLSDVYQLKNPVFQDRYHTAETLIEIRDEYNLGQKFYGRLTNALVTALVLRIFRGEEYVERPPQPGKGALSNYKKLLEKIEESADLSFDDAAAFMNMSPAYFSRYFKKLTGMTYTQYLNAARVEKAIELMYSEPLLTSKDLMVRTGFGTLRNFNRVFREITGFSPKNLPESYVFTIRTSLQTEEGSFNPTLGESQLLRMDMPSSENTD
ncbi:MAG: helix-turn-helix domain-containing protein [Spirochaetales bacterium]|nr:helix-turn-helix domain-containing protein [Candidatus Physcosoma equi]